ncbi:MAG: hypothetical protein ACOYON_16350, partial [Fimbriimonas sp.]
SRRGRKLIRASKARVLVPGHHNLHLVAHLLVELRRAELRQRLMPLRAWGLRSSATRGSDRSEPARLRSVAPFGFGLRVVP